MKLLPAFLVFLSVACVAEAWTTSPSRVVTTSRTGSSSGRTEESERSHGRTASSSNTQLGDLVDGNLQWYRETSTSASAPPSTVTQETINRKLCNAAERFMKFQGGYFSPMTSNDNTNDNINNTNDYSNGYDDPSSILADDFVFRGPVIGPLNKWDYIDVLDYFGIYEAFPDINPNCFGFTVDVVDPLKVRLFVKATGTYQNPLGGFMGKVGTAVAKPDGREYVGSTEAWSITFNDLDRMQVRCITAGYVVDRFEEQGTLCTTNGKGLSFGILNTIGIDFLPTQPGSAALKFVQWTTGQFSKKGGAADALFPKAYSAPSEVPQWWRDERRGAD